jgi:hypothetical protein
MEGGKVGVPRLSTLRLELLALKVLAQPERLAYRGALREALALPEEAFSRAAHRALFRTLSAAASQAEALSLEELRRLVPQAELDGVDLQGLFGPLGAGPATVRQRLRAWRKSMEGDFF